MDLESVFPDDRAGPDAIHQFVFGDEIAGRVDQDLDNLERATPDGDGNAACPQFTARKIDLVLTRLVNWSVAPRWHSRDPWSLGPFTLAAPPRQLLSFSPASLIREHHASGATALGGKPSIARAARKSAVSKPSVKRP